MFVVFGKLLLQDVNDNIGRVYFEKIKLNKKWLIVFMFVLNILVCLFFIIFFILKKLLFLV